MLSSDSCFPSDCFFFFFLMLKNRALTTSPPISSGSREIQKQRVRRNNYCIQQSSSPPVLANMIGLRQSLKSSTGYRSVKQRIIFEILLFTYTALIALAPQYISDFLVQYKPPRALRSSDKKLFHFKLKT